MVEPINVTYEGHFASFDEVLSNFTDTTNYHSPQSEAREVEEAILKLSKYESGNIPEEGCTLTRLNFLPTALSLLPKTSIGILDVGGGLGTTFIDLKYCLPKKNIAMTVLELPLISHKGHEIFRQYPNLKFTSSMPTANSNFDVVYFGSSLQYFEDYTAVLFDSIKLSPEFVIIADTTMGTAPSFVCAQVNMPGRVIPRMVFNIGEIVEILDQRNYQLVHRSLNYSPIHNFENYENPIRSSAHWNLIFQRCA